MGRSSKCLRNIFTTNYKPKWITTLLKSCKDNNTNNRALDPTPTINSASRNRSDSIECAFSHATDSSNTAAEAAVFAAQATFEVVRITRSGRFNFDPSHRAAVRIQSVFRGYLARKALRALKALVRLQALVRGYVVRKQAVDQVRRMQALIRAQARARAIRAPVPTSSYSSSRTFHSCILDPPTPEDSQYAAQGWKSFPDTVKLGSGRASTRRLDEGKFDKIVEVDSYMKPYSSIKNKNLFLLSDYSSHNGYQTPAVTYLSEDLYLQYSNEIDRYSFYTADSIPPFHAGSFRSISARRGGNVDCSGSYNSGYQDHPNYMACTKSSKAKMRSLSAPRQRTQLDRSTSQKCYSSHDNGSRRLSASGAADQAEVQLSRLLKLGKFSYDFVQSS